MRIAGCLRGKQAPLGAPARGLGARLAGPGRPWGGVGAQGVRYGVLRERTRQYRRT